MNGSNDSPVNTQSKPFQEDGLRRVWKAGLHSFEGIGSALKHEAAFRQECVAALLLVPLALALNLPLVEKVLLIGVVFLVMITELMNTAVEWCVDYISTERHPFAKRAKDIGSAAVLLSLILAIGTWTLILSSHFLTR